jgi:hypothetical protein
MKNKVPNIICFADFFTSVFDSIPSLQKLHITIYDFIFVINYEFFLQFYLYC